MRISAWMFPMWWADRYTCQKSLFPCNLTPTEPQDIFSPLAQLEPAAVQVQYPGSGHAKKIRFASCLRSQHAARFHHREISGRKTLPSWMLTCGCRTAHCTARLCWSNAIVEIFWRSCYRFLGGHVAEISLLKSQVSFCLHTFPNTSWSLSPSGFQRTIIKMNLASCAFDLIPFFFSWASRIKQCDMQNYNKKRTVASSQSTLPPPLQI